MTETVDLEVVPQSGRCNTLGNQSSWDGGGISKHIDTSGSCRRGEGDGLASLKGRSIEGSGWSRLRDCWKRRKLSLLNCEGYEMEYVGCCEVRDWIGKAVGLKERKNKGRSLCQN